MIPFAYIAVAACLAVDAGSDHVLARDLVPAYPEMASLDPATWVAFAPAPGVSRIFRIADLRLLAVRFNLPAPPDREICVERPVAALNPSALLAAMRNALPDARIEILEYSRQPAPAGQIEFPRDGLHDQPLRQGSLWNGLVRYAGNRRFAIWARVRVAASTRRVVALGDLKPGRPIEAGQLIVQTREEFPAGGTFAQTIDQVTGKWPRLTIRAGVEVRMDQLNEPKEVTHGETVKVDVFSGMAHLEFEGMAESSGAPGEMISVLNPASNKRFRARVVGKGRVSVGAKSARETS